MKVNLQWYESQVKERGDKDITNIPEEMIKDIYERDTE